MNGDNLHVEVKSELSTVAVCQHDKVVLSNKHVSMYLCMLKACNIRLRKIKLVKYMHCEPSYYVGYL